MVAAESEAPPAAVRDLLAASIGEWYPRCSAYTFRSAIIELDDEFVRWLVSDGVAASGGNRAVRLWARTRRTAPRRASRGLEAQSGQGSVTCSTTRSTTERVPGARRACRKGLSSLGLRVS